MDLRILYQPYATGEAPNIESLMTWLAKNGLPQHNIDQALLQVFDAMDRGKMTFVKDVKHSSTWYLWQEVLAAGKALQEAETKLYADHLQSFHTKMRQAWSEDLIALAKTQSWLGKVKTWTKRII
jgi:hypothetical protein